MNGNGQNKFLRGHRGIRSLHRRVQAVSSISAHEPKLPRAQAYVTDESNMPVSACLAAFASI